MVQRIAYGKHFIGLVKDEHLHGIGLEEAALDHILNTARGTNDDLRTVLKSLHVITDAGTANAGVALNVHEVTDGDNDLLDLLGKLTGRSKDESLALLDSGVDLLEDGDGEGGSLASTGLSLGNDIVTLDNGHDSALLDSRGTLETISVDWDGTCQRRGLAQGGLGNSPPRRSSDLRFMSSKESTVSS